MINQEKVLRMTKMASMKSTVDGRIAQWWDIFAAIISENRLLFH